jgi:hypothetical protein
MSLETLQREFLKLPKSERIFFGRFVVENIFSNMEETMLTEAQQAQVVAQHELYKEGKLKLIPLAEFRENVKKTHGI